MTTFYAGDRVERVRGTTDSGSHPPAIGAKGTVLNDTTPSSRFATVRVRWDNYTHHAGGIYNDYASTLIVTPKETATVKETKSLRDKVIEFLSKPERSDADSWFKWLGDSVFFSMTDAQVEHFVRQLIDGELSGYPDFCSSGKEKFVYFLGDLAPKRAQWVRKTLTFKELRSIYYNAGSYVRMRFPSANTAYGKTIDNVCKGSAMDRWFRGTPTLFDNLTMEVEVWE